MSEKKNLVYYLYTTIPGRILLKGIQKCHADHLVVRFLRSGFSRPFLRWYIKHNEIDLPDNEQKYWSFREFFVRNRGAAGVDLVPGHLISPCDGWLSAYPIQKDSNFFIKGSRYQVGDFLEDYNLARNYEGGVCLVFRLSASDYHHYLYIDDGYQGKNHFIPGILHSVQPIACRSYPVYVLNRRSWCLLTTENFGPVVQTEIGALIVGGIVNYRENTRVCKGMEKGFFDLAGSTIVLLFEPERICILPGLKSEMDKKKEVRVEMGQKIAYRSGKARL